MGTSEEIIDRGRFEQQLSVVAGQLRCDKLVVAAIGGMPTAEVADVIGLSSENVGVLGTGKGLDDHYVVSPIIRFVHVEGRGCLADQVVGAGDEAANSHGLLPTMAKEIRKVGGIPVTYAFMARKADPKIMPSIYAETCPGTPAKPYWESEQREPGVVEVLERAKRLGISLKAMIAIGSLTAAAETAKALGTIRGMHVGALPYNKHGGIDTTWLELGDCGGRNVMVFGNADVDLEHAAHLVTQAKGTPYIFRLEQPNSDTPVVL